MSSPYKKNAHAFITQAAFLENQHGEILLLQLPDGCWQLPGGKLHSKEHWQAGVVREIYEETGLKDVSVIDVLYIDNWHTAHHDYYRAYFWCTTSADEVHLSDDHEAYCWVDADTDISELEFTHETVRAHIERFWNERG